MANKLSAAQAALRDMQACKLDISMFNGCVKSTIILNELCDIQNDRVGKPCVKKQKYVPFEEVHTGFHYQRPDMKLDVKVIIRIINPDGTIGISRDWDFD